MAKYLRIAPDGDHEYVECDSLEELQEAVGGGLITGVPTRAFKGTVYANDEGIIKGMAYNFKASVLAKIDLVGPVIFGGPADAEGRTTDYRDDLWTDRVSL